MIDRINPTLRKLPAWPLYVFVVAMIVYLFWKGQSGALGPEPIKALEHELGRLSLQFLVAGLAVTPLRRFTGLNLIKFRRAIGLTAFYFMLAHLLVWLVLDLQSWQLIWKDIVKRPYITIGMVGFLMCLPLALTSNNWSLRKLGPRWRKLHRLVYPVCLLGAVHFVMVVKGWQVEPLVYLALVAGLLVLRRVPRKAAPRRQPLRPAPGAS